MHRATVRSLLIEGKSILRKAGLPSAGLESALLLASTLGVSREWLIMNSQERVDSSSTRKYRAWIRRRRSHYPVQYLLGEWGFWQDTFLVRPGVLIPRPETELIIETAIEKLAAVKGDQIRILELGVGSGALLLSLLRQFPAADGFGMDRSAVAIDIARRNTLRLGLSSRARLWQGNLAGGLKAEPRFDLVVFNPPYLTSREIREARTELKFEPRRAFDGGKDGLRYYVASAENLKYVTRPKGWLLMELSPLRADKVRKLFADAGWQDVDIRRDLAGRKRVLCACVGSAAVARG